MCRVANHQTRLPRATSSLALNASRDGTSTASMANHSQLGFQDASSPIIEELVEFHDHALIVALAICSLVLYLLTLTLIEKLSSNTVDAQEVELI